MKTIIAFLCLASSLIANEVPIEEVKIDPLLKVKEQFSKSRKKGWDFSEENKKSQPQKKSEGITFEFSTGTKNYHPMQKSQEMMKSFRNDISETERAKRLDRLSELDHTYKPPRNRNSR